MKQQSEEFKRLTKEMIALKSQNSSKSLKQQQTDIIDDIIENNSRIDHTILKLNNHLDVLDKSDNLEENIKMILRLTRFVTHNRVAHRFKTIQDKVIKVMKYI